MKVKGKNYRSIWLDKKKSTVVVIDQRQLPHQFKLLYLKNIKEIKKGDKILHSHMGSQPPVSGIVMESPIVGRGIRSTLLVDVKGSEVGMFDEIGSIYTKEVLKVFRDDNWLPVEHAT